MVLCFMFEHKIIKLYRITHVLYSLFPVHTICLTQINNTPFLIHIVMRHAEYVILLHMNDVLLPCRYVPVFVGDATECCCQGV